MKTANEMIERAQEAMVKVVLKKESVAVVQLSRRSWVLVKFFGAPIESGMKGEAFPITEKMAENEVRKLVRSGSAFEGLDGSGGTTVYTWAENEGWEEIEGHHTIGARVVMENWNFPDITGTVEKVLQDPEGKEWWVVGGRKVPASSFLWYADTPNRRAQ
jgi:hypothetical protein